VLSGSGQLYAFLGIVVIGGAFLYLVTRRMQGPLDASSYEDAGRPPT
jgi:hypothetical protein